MVLPAPLTAVIESYDTDIDEKLLAEQKATTIQTTLYHYTTALGLKGILESQSIWFSDYRDLNDPSELLHGIAMCRDVTRGLANGSDSNVVELLKIVDELMTQRNFATRLDFFIACFSAERDDLGQWRAYADNGRGFALGLSPRFFQIQEKKGKQPDDNVFVGPVVYDVAQVLERHSSLLEPAIKVLLHEVERGCLGNDAVRDEFMWQLARSMVAGKLIWNCLTTKHPAYKHEQEVRLIILGSHEVLRPFIKTRIRGSDVVPYIAHAMPVREKHSIAEVIAGPAAPADAERTVRTLLESFDIDPNVAVGRSQTPYRAV